MSFQIQKNRLAKLNLLLDKLRRGVNLQNRRLATWLTEAECESLESQLQIREELSDKPNELKRYEDQLKKAVSHCSMNKKDD